MGRSRRLATRAQRRALLRRDGGCARPGCTETRIERLHAHHMRWWSFGGRTDIANMVLLCDVDHGLVHEHDLVMTRRAGELVVRTPEGRRIWGAPDTAFATGRSAPADPDGGAEAMVRVLFPGGAPPVPEGIKETGERMDMRYVVGLLMGNRDLERRLAAEAGGGLATAA